MPDGIDLRGMKIVVDCANGATYKVAPRVFRELGAEVIPIGCSAERPEHQRRMCGSTAPGAAAALTVLENRADLGIALDGDGDRVMMVDENGELVDGDQLLYIIAGASLISGH